MSESKFIMAQRLHDVQVKLMGETINDDSLDVLLPLIFQRCSEQKLTFWFNFYEHECVLNLRDVSHENYELNIRQYIGDSLNLDNIEDIKKQVLVNAFLITKECVTVDVASSEKSSIISTDKPTPKHIQNAIQKIQDKGIPVTPQTIHNHLPLHQMSTNERLKCNKYLKQMEDST